MLSQIYVDIIVTHTLALDRVTFLGKEERTERATTETMKMTKKTTTTTAAIVMVMVVVDNTQRTDKCERYKSKWVWSAEAAATAIRWWRAIEPRRQPINKLTDKLTGFVGHTLQVSKSVSQSLYVCDQWLSEDETKTTRREESGQGFLIDRHNSRWGSRCDV